MTALLETLIACAIAENSCQRCVRKCPLGVATVTRSPCFFILTLQLYYMLVLQQSKKRLSQNEYLNICLFFPSLFLKVDGWMPYYFSIFLQTKNVVAMIKLIVSVQLFAVGQFWAWLNDYHLSSTIAKSICTLWGNSRNVANKSPALWAILSINKNQFSFRPIHCDDSLMACIKCILYVKKTIDTNWISTVRFTERHCEAFKPFRCPDNGQCISIQYLCDGAPDCQDGYDEDPRLCTAGTTPSEKTTDHLFMSKAIQNW